MPPVTTVTARCVAPFMPSTLARLCIPVSLRTGCPGLCVALRARCARLFRLLPSGLALLIRPALGPLLTARLICMLLALAAFAVFALAATTTLASAATTTFTASLATSFRRSLGTFAATGALGTAAAPPAPTALFLARLGVVLVRRRIADPDHRLADHFLDVS